MIHMQLETLADALQDIGPLLENHYEEICAHPELLQLNPDLDRYHLIQAAGGLQIYTARDRGELVGYVVSILGPHLHYRDTIQAIVDLIYIDPEMRGGTLGYRLLKGALRELRNSGGAELISVHMKVKHPFRSLLSKLGFELVEENWEVAGPWPEQQQ